MQLPIGWEVHTLPLCFAMLSPPLLESFLGKKKVCVEIFTPLNRKKFRLSRLRQISERKKKFLLSYVWWLLKYLRASAISWPFKLPQPTLCVMWPIKLWIMAAVWFMPVSSTCMLAFLSYKMAICSTDVCKYCSLQGWQNHISSLLFRPHSIMDVWNMLFGWTYAVSLHLGWFSK